jgi:Ni,Fe-hydrogenase I large subunit
VAWVETSRGRLHHFVALQDGRLRRYRILAPTEWNFHPRGVAAALLAALPPGAGLRARAERVVHVVDPCVGCRIDLEPAGLRPAEAAADA